MKSETVVQNAPNKLQTSVAIPELYIFISSSLSQLLSFNSFCSVPRLETVVTSTLSCFVRFFCVCVSGVNDKVNSYSFDFMLRSTPS